MKLNDEKMYIPPLYNKVQPLRLSAFRVASLLRLLDEAGESFMVTVRVRRQELMSRGCSPSFRIGAYLIKSLSH